MLSRTWIVKGTGFLVNVVMVMGLGRAGSTIIDRVLGTVPGVASTGELRYLWERGMIEGRLCSCGRQVGECVLWSQVVGSDDAAGGLKEVDPARVVSLQTTYARVRHVRRVWREHLRSNGGARDAGLQELLKIRLRLYERISEATDCRTIVDSSKSPTDVALASLLPGVSVFAVHLVRDPRAVAYSWQKVLHGLDSTNSSILMPRYSIAASSRMWMEQNMASEYVRWRMGNQRSMLVRYEDFVSDPTSVAHHILARAGVDGEAAFVTRSAVLLGEDHLIGGNPNRFSAGEVQIRMDDAWRAGLKSSQRRSVMAMTAPLAWRYGYFS